MVGNSLTSSINVQSTFGSASTIQTIWKWDSVGARWAFFAPSMDALKLKEYADSKGYAVLSSIEPGEGYWVNVGGASSIDRGVLSGEATEMTASKLKQGWNLVASGSDLSPANFSAGVGDITTLWAWDNAQSAWYFYAPSLVSSNTLASYIQTKNYKDFGALTLGKGLGFWVNYAGTTNGGTGGTGGTTWTAANAVAGSGCRSFKAAVQGGSTWVAVGDSGCIRTSSNGVDWSAGSQPVTGSNLLDVTYANGRYVAVGTSGKSQTSVNGTDWTQSTQTTYPTTMNAVIWTGSKFLAATDVSASPNFGYNLYSSTDGASWTAQKITTDATVGANSLRLTGIAANGNTLVAVGGATTNCVAWRSTDGGSNWTSVGSKTCGQTPGTHDGRFQLGSGIGEDSALSVAYGNGKFVAIGALGSWATSTDGVTWTTGAIDASGGVFVRPYRIYFDGSQFVVVGNQRRIYTSTNGQTWTTRNIDTTVAYNSANNFHGIAGTATGRLVVVGSLATDGTGFKTSVP
jgi:hypothetical protein